MVQEKSETKTAMENNDLEESKPSRMDCIPILHVRGTHYFVGRAIVRCKFYSKSLMNYMHVNVI